MRSLYERYVRPYAASYGLIIVGCLALFAIRPRENTASFERYNHALIAAHTRDRDTQHDARVLAEHEREVMRREAARARVAYRIARDSAAKLVAVLPKASVQGDVITLNDIAYPVPHPVAVAWVQRDSAIAAQGTALAKGDDAVSETVKEVASADSVSSHAVKEADAATALASDEKARADALTPSRWEKIKGALRGSSRYALVAVGAFALGMVAK